jgi:hypothetical protein
MQSLKHNFQYHRSRRQWLAHAAALVGVSSLGRQVIVENRAVAGGKSASLKQCSMQRRSLPYSQLPFANALLGWSPWS